MQPTVKAEDLKKKFDHLAIELAVANTHLFFAQRLSDAKSRELSKPFLLSWDFWNYTINAHLQAAFVRLCRLYDTYRDSRNRGPEKDAFHLLRYVEDVEKMAVPVLVDDEADLHREDLEFLQKQSDNTNPPEKIIALREWRNTLMAHSNEAFITSDKKDFFVTHKLEVEHFDFLIQKGFEILERWARYYGGGTPVQRLLERASDEWLFVVDLLGAGFAAKGATIIR